MVIDGKGVLLVSTEFKHVQYFLCNGHVFLLKLVEMLSGSTYFRCISMNFLIICLIF